MSSFRVARLFAFVLAATLCAPAARAQVNEGRFTGTVLDASGSAVPGASVDITTSAPAKRGRRRPTVRGATW